MSRAWFLVSRALLSKYRKMSRPKKPCHGHFLGFLSRALILMSRPLFLVQNCHGLFFDVTAIFSKNVTGTKKNVTGKKKHCPRDLPLLARKKKRPRRAKKISPSFLAIQWKKNHVFFGLKKKKRPRTSLGWPKVFLG